VLYKLEVKNSKLRLGTTIPDTADVPHFISSFEMNNKHHPTCDLTSSRSHTKMLRMAGTILARCVLLFIYRSCFTRQHKLRTARSFLAMWKMEWLVVGLR